MASKKTPPKTVVRILVRSWMAPVSGTGAQAMMAPSIAVQEVLSERGYDDALHRARCASDLDPFALELGLDRLARDLLLGSKMGRPKLLADVLGGLLPQKAKPPREVLALLRAAAREDRASLPSIARELATPGFARELFRTAVTDPLSGAPAARMAVAERLLALATEAMTIFYYPLLARPELTEAVAHAARQEEPGSAVHDALLRALATLDRYIVDVRTRPLLLASLASPSAQGRALAASTLLRYANATAWPKERWAKVIALLDDADAKVREHVSFALLANRGHLAAPELRLVLEALERHLQDRVLGVRMNAVSGLVSLRGRSFLGQARALAKGEKNKRMRLVLTRAIAELS